jgi:hypothetical protein
MNKSPFSEDIDLDYILNDEYIASYLNELWVKSLPYGAWAEKNEHGCWIYNNNNSGLFYDDMEYRKEKRRDDVNCYSPKKYNNSVLVAWFHTHPFINGRNGKYYDGNYDIRPSKGDKIFSLIHNIPGIVYTHSGYAFFKGSLS